MSPDDIEVKGQGHSDL